MKTVAAVLVEPGKPLVLADVEIPPLRPGQTLVEIRFSGVCHTQLLECRGHRGEDRYLPHGLGHEGSGAVLETGPGVTKVKPGGVVILSWIKGSGLDVPGTTYRWGDRLVNAGALTTFARHAVISENRLTPLPEGTPLREAAFLGCAVATGVGAVLNTARPQAGQSAVVFGVGGIGLCAVAGAALAGCRPVIAVDLKPEKLEAARRLGATQVVCAADEDPVPAILKLCPGGADIAVEATGRPAVMRQALEAVRPRGGAAVVIGNARHGERVEFDPWHLNQGKRLLGTWGGDSVPDRDFPRYAEWLRSGRLDLSPLQSPPYRLEDINAALDDLEAGRAIRPVVDLTAPCP